jgi:cell wall-associated NlpC family hydrolase
MRTRASRRIVQTAAGAAMAVAVAMLGITSAQATDSVSSGCSGIRVTHSETSTRAAIAQISKCLGGLQKNADTAGRIAQQADERYLKSKRAAATAAAKLHQAQTAADAAAAKARHSRSRAGLVTVQLARSGSTDQAGNLLLDGGGAKRVLYRLSRISQLTVESHKLSRQAADDSARASVLESRAAAAEQDARAQASVAQHAYLAAKKQSDAARAVLRKQQARQQQLQAVLATLQNAQGTGGSAASSASGGPTLTDLAPNASKAARAVAFARAQIGEPYVFAAAGPSSWDCSGLTLMAYASVGVSIGIHSATAQYDYAASHGRLVSYSQRQAGDLLFYTDGGGDMYHVAIYSGNGMMIEAPYEGVPVREVPVRGYQLAGQVARPTA